MNKIFYTLKRIYPSLLVLGVFSLMLGGAIIYRTSASDKSANHVDSTRAEVNQKPTTSKSTATTPLNTQHNPSSSSQSTHSNYTYKPYVASVCSKTPIPYKTVYINVSYLAVGDSYSAGGTDGYLETCTPDSYGYKPSDFTFHPFDKTVYVGVGSSSTTTTNPPVQHTYQQAANYCSGHGVPSDSSAWQLCINAYLSQ